MVLGEGVEVALVDVGMSRGVTGAASAGIISPVDAGATGDKSGG